MVAVAVLIEAGCAVRPYLAGLLDSDASAVDAEFSDLLLLDPRPADIGDRLQELFERDENTHEWLLAFLDDPAMVPPELQAVRAAPGTVAVPATRYRCPQAEHLVWYRIHISVPVPRCVVHACELVTP